MTTSPLDKKYQPANCSGHVPVPQGKPDAEGRQQWECMLCGQGGWATLEEFQRKYGRQPQR